MLEMMNLTMPTDWDRYRYFQELYPIASFSTNFNIKILPRKNVVQLSRHHNLSVSDNLLQHFLCS